MTGVLLITHGSVGESMLAMAEETLGCCPLPVKCLAVGADDDPVEVLDRGQQLVQAFDCSEIIILTDVYGSTPSNIATQLAQKNPGMVMVAGLNIPMLLRLMNYPDEPMAIKIEKAVSGGRNGILIYEPGQED